MPDGAPGDAPDVRLILAEPSRLELVAQPIIDVRRGVIVGYEALSRFNLEPRTSPDRVFAEATRQGLGSQLEALVITRALELARKIPRNCFFSLNVDPGHLLVPAVRDAVLSQGDLAGIVIELTEHREVDDAKPLIKELESLRSRGAFIAMDDAGSGYSGLRQILQYRPQILKLDRELVSNVNEDDAKRAMIEMLGELAGRLDAWLLAEGIETESELRVLRQLGVPLAQGYFLAKPGTPWAEMLPAAREALSGAPPSASRAQVVRQLLEPCTTCKLGEAWPAEGLAVRVNDEGRPVEMRCTIAGETFTREERELLRVKAESPLGAVAQRAATRLERVRWDPLVCIDDAGLFRGIVRMSRVVYALGEEAPPPSRVAVN
ncbi:MAG TPA: EAL domain-containing protein [Polyangiaceae bacterium]|nr:EAL domain-containing protein [Polyangiaceae bacterium]